MRQPGSYRDVGQPGSYRELRNAGGAPVFLCLMGTMGETSGVG
jgi:hypothetical protein